MTIIICTLMLSCTSAVKRQVNELHYSDDFVLSTTKSTELFSEFRQQQVFTMYYADSVYSGSVVLQYRNSVLSLYAFSAMGLSLFEAEFKNGQLTFESSQILPKSLNPESILFDIILVYAEYSALESAVSGQVRVKQNENFRSIFVNNKRHISIEYLPTKMTAKIINFENHKKKYKFKIQILKSGFQ